MSARISMTHVSLLRPPHVRRLVPLLVALAVGCGGSDSPTTPGTPGTPGTPTVTTSVAMQGTAFIPSAIKVSPGATVTFTNQDGFDHTVTFANSSITSIDAFPTGSRTTVMPATAGTYSYKCTIHPSMTGTVQVQ